jgi:hypothetical protein
MSRIIAGHDIKAGEHFIISKDEKTGAVMAFPVTYEYRGRPHGKTHVDLYEGLPVPRITGIEILDYEKFAELTGTTIEG